MAPGIDQLSEFAMDAIHLAGEKAMAYYGKGRPQVKFDESVVTEAELQLTDVFQNQLREQFPEHQLFRFGEVNEDYSHGQKRYLWIFDPLEGVANFQGGIPIWGMSIALLENFWPIFGVFYMPATGDLFHARAGKEAFWGNDKIRISTSGNMNDESLFQPFRAKSGPWDAPRHIFVTWPWGAPTRRLLPVNLFRGSQLCASSLKPPAEKFVNLTVPNFISMNTLTGNASKSTFWWRLRKTFPKSGVSSSGKPSLAYR